MRYNLFLLLVLATIWAANSGHYTPLILGFGLVSIVMVLLLSKRMQLVGEEAQPLHLLRRLPSFYAWLWREIVVSNLAVTACVWRGKNSISPTTASVPVHLKTRLGRVIYANSITLTPGTVSIHLGEDEILVHALRASDLAALQEGEMQQRVSRLEQ